MRPLLAISILLLGAAATAQPDSAEVALVELPAVAAVGTASNSEVLTSDLSLVQPMYSLGGFLVVRAEVDGIEGNYVLDSGAPGLIVNRPARPGDVLVSAEALNGGIAFARTTVESFAWGAVRQQGITAYAVDLDYLTEALGTRIDGMIGYDQLRVAPLTLDFDAGSLTQHSTENRFEPTAAVRLRMRMRGHVPALKGRIDGRRLRLALDTGAGVNVLDDDRLRRLGDDAHEPMDDMLLRGLDANSQRVPRARVHLTEIADANWIGLPFAFADLSGFAKAGLRVDGVLGKEWLQRHRVTLDYGRGHVWVE